MAINMDFRDDMRKLLLGKENEKPAHAQEHDKEERKNVASEAESGEVAQATDEGQEQEKSQSQQASEDFDEQGSAGREALEDALRGEEESEESEEEDTEEKAAATEEDEIEPPSHWKKTDQEMFRTLPKDSKEFLLEQSKHFQADYMRKVNDLKGMIEAVDPIKEEMTKRGISRSQAIRNLVARHVNMRDNPAEALKQTFIDYGVDPVEFVSKWDEVEALNEKMAKTKNEGVSKERQAEFERNKEIVAQKLNEWAQDKEYAPLVENQMAAIAQTYINQGQTPPHIDDIYEEACWAHPEVRKKMKEKEALIVSTDERKRLQRSKKAANSSIKKESVGKQRRLRSSDMTQREELATLLGQSG